jgi:hypothetical protein
MFVCAQSFCVYWFTNTYTAKPIKKACVTPTSRINDLEVVIEDLEKRLSKTVAQLANILEADTSLRQELDLSAILKAEEARVKQREAEQRELAAERKEREAAGRELRAMSDIVTQLWESFRTVTSSAGFSASNPAPGTVTPHIFPRTGRLNAGNRTTGCLGTNREHGSSRGFRVCRG